MAIYWIMFAMFAVGAFASRGEDTSGKVGATFIVAMAIAALIVGLRWQIGPDWQAYSLIYSDAGRISLEQVLKRHDQGFYFVAWSLNWFHAPFWTLNLAMAAILFYGLFRFSQSLANPWLAITVAVPYLIIVVGMSLIRQAAAMGFVFLALRHVGIKPLWKSLGWVLVGSLFHASAIIVGLLIAVSYTKNRLSAAFLLILSVVPCYFLLSSTVGDYFQRYDHQVLDSGGVYFRLLINAVPAMLLFALRRRGIVPAEEYKLWRNLALISLFLLPVPLLVRSTTSIDRLSMYAIPLQLLVLSNFPTVGRQTSARYVNIAGIVLYSAITLSAYFSFGTHARYFAPYRSIFGDTSGVKMDPIGL